MRRWEMDKHKEGIGNVEVERINLGDIGSSKDGEMVGGEGGFWDGEVKEVERGDRKREEDEERCGEDEEWRRLKHVGVKVGANGG